MAHGNCSTDPADASVLPVKPPKSNAAAQVLVPTVVYISLIHSNSQVSATRSASKHLMHAFIYFFFSVFPNAIEVIVVRCCARMLIMCILVVFECVEGEDR